MKKLVLITCFILTCLSLFSQEIQETTVTISSKTLINGGNYLLIPATLGRTTEIESLAIKYDFNTTPYTIGTTDSLTVQTTTISGSVENIAHIQDDGFEGSVKGRLRCGVVNTSYAYNNSINLNIPAGKFTLGDSDIYVIIEYSLAD